jgi:hypothetical protein
MVFFIGGFEPFFEFEFHKPIHFFRHDGVKVMCGSMTVEWRGMYAYLEGGYGNCISGTDDNNRHDLHYRCLYEIEYNMSIKPHLSPKQVAYIDKLYKKGKFQFAGEKSYFDLAGDRWILSSMKGKKYAMRSEKGNYVHISDEEFKLYQKVDFV